MYVTYNLSRKEGGEGGRDECIPRACWPVSLDNWWAPGLVRDQEKRFPTVGHGKKASVLCGNAGRLSLLAPEHDGPSSRHIQLCRHNSGLSQVL